MNQLTETWRRWSGMIFWSIVGLTVFGWIAGVADFFASALSLGDWLMAYLSAFGSGSDREMLSALDSFETVATALQFVCLVCWLLYLVGLRNFREPQTSESAVEGVKSVYSACWVGIVSVALSFVGGLLPDGFRWVFTVPAWIMLLVSYIMFRSAFRSLQNEATWSKRARSGAGLLRKSANYNVRLMLFPLFALIVGAITVFVVASVLHSSQSDPRQMLKIIVSVAGAEFVILAVLLLWMSVMQFVYRLMGWYRIWKNAPIAETSESEPMLEAASKAAAEPSTAATSKKRGAIIGGSVGAATVLIGMLALFSKGCGSGDGAKLTDSVYVYNDQEIPGTLYRGIDGSDYYIAVIPFGEEMTWQEAMALEKDGWQLPKSMGHFHGTDFDGEKNEGRMEYRTPDTDTPDPVIERMVGEPALLVSRVAWTGFPNIVGMGEFWTATELNANNAVYFTIRQYPDGIKMSSIVDSGDSKEVGKMVMLVKRIPSEASLYTNPATGRQAQSICINGYEVVDPSGGLGLAYLTNQQLKYANRYYFPEGTNDVSVYEVDGWHVPSVAEISAICGTEIMPGQTVNIGRSEDFLRVFPPSNSLEWTRYHVRDARGNFKALHVRPLNDGTVELTVRNTRSGAGMRMRLVRSVDGETVAPVEETIAAVSDAEMMGLKGPVERVENWFEFSERPERVMTFDADGCLIVPAGITAERDDLGRLTKYADERNPDSEESFTYEVQYDGDGMRPVSWSSANIGSSRSIKLKFEANGDLKSTEETYWLEGDEYEYYNDNDFTIIERDDRGNWTKREVVVDEYFVGAELADHTVRSYKEIRKITYHK